MWCSPHVEGKVLLQRRRGFLAAFAYADTEEETEMKPTFRMDTLKLDGRLDSACNKFQVCWSGTC